MAFATIACGATDSAESQREDETMTDHEWPSAPGLHRIERDLGGSATHLGVHLPPGFDPSRPHALAIVLHYGGQPTPHYGAGLLEQLFIEGLAELDAILVAPDSLQGNWSSAPNRRMLPALLAALRDTYAIDDERILLTGYSMGGVGTWALAGEGLLPITAALPVSSAPGSTLPSVATHAVHSTADEVFAVGPVREAIERLSQNVPASLTVVEGLGHYQIREHTDAVKTAAHWIHERWTQ